MELSRHRDADELERVAGSFLLRREAEHNLGLGILAGLRNGQYDTNEAYLASVADSGRIVAVALRTPPHNLVLSCVDDLEALPALASDVQRVSPDLPGVVGPTTASRTFADEWSRLTGTSSQPGMAMRIHRVGSAVEPTDVPGDMRDATDDDVDLLAGWGLDFQKEALAEDVDRSTARRWAERMVTSATSGLALWVDGDVVSMAGYGGPTPRGIRIFAVYTPPELRGCGYATACVARLTRRLLDDGRRFCFLFTDLANPTSNAIYRRIGYEPVIDVDEHRFAAESSP